MILCGQPYGGDRLKLKTVGLSPRDAVILRHILILEAFQESQHPWFPVPQGGARPFVPWVK